MIRTVLLSMYVGGVIVFAWKDWYAALCGLILLVGVIQHPDMPRNILGFQGLNPWNLALVGVSLAWLSSRGRERLRWDMPRYASVLLALYAGVLLTGFLRMFSDRESIRPLFGGSAAPGYLIGENLVNVIKWVVPGMLLFDGCRSRRRFDMAVATILALYMILALQVIKWMPPQYLADGDALTQRSRKVLLKEVGFHPINLSMMFAGASWAMLLVRTSLRESRMRLVAFGAALSLMYAQALTAGRMGYATWATLGLTLGVLRWRRFLLLIPVAVLLVSVTVPGAVDRLLKGFDTEATLEGERLRTDESKITSGRSVIWPYVIDKILESPIIGFGRLAMNRTGLESFLWTELGEDFAHPHNAYLEVLLDNGVVGFVIIVSFYVMIMWRSVRLFRDSRSPVFVAAGGLAFCLVAALMVASIGSQTFYPREGAVGMWCAIGVLFRVLVQRRRADAMAALLAHRRRAEQEAHDGAGSSCQRAPSSIDDLLWEAHPRAYVRHTA